MAKAKTNEAWLYVRFNSQIRLKIWKSRNAPIFVSIKKVGCMDPTEPFQCPGTTTCISIQFMCDGQPGDCPDNYDADPGVCIACEYTFLILKISERYWARLFYTFFLSEASAKRHDQKISCGSIQQLRNSIHWVHVRRQKRLHVQQAVTFWGYWAIISIAFW